MAVRRGPPPYSRVGVSLCWLSAGSHQCTSRNRSLRPSSSSRRPRECFVSIARHATFGANLKERSHSRMQCGITYQFPCDFSSVVACIFPFIFISCINWCFEKTTQNPPSVEALQDDSPIDSYNKIASAHPLTCWEARMSVALWP